MLAVLKTGAAYVPIDPAHSAARMAFVLADAKPIAVITTAALRGRLDSDDVLVVDVADPALGSASNALAMPAADEIAYLIYTSGTTGSPKAVAIAHHNVTWLVGALDAGLPPGSVWTQCHSPGLRLLGVGDMGCAAVRSATCRGARRGGEFPRTSTRYWSLREVSVLTQTPSAVAMLPCEQLESMTLVVGGGLPARVGAAVGRTGAS